MNYAGFWIRAAACIIDFVILVVIGTFFGVFTGADWLAQLLVNYVSAWVYTAGLTSSHFQATLGKKVLGLKVVDLNGGRISFAHASGRWLAEILSGIILGIGYLMIAFNSKKQGLHDQIAGTYVIKNIPSEI